MPSLHARWFCRDCTREWGAQSRTIDLSNPKDQGRVWAPADGCPACKSASIERVEYTPTFTGGDIPRAPVDVPIAPDVSPAQILGGIVPIDLPIAVIRSARRPVESFAPEFA